MRLRRWRASGLLVQALVLSWAPMARAEGEGVVRGTVYDLDFGSPLPGARVSIAETGTEITATDEGNYVIDKVPPGAYTLVIKKEGYAQVVKPNVVVSAGQMAEVDASLAGEFTEMEEFMVQDIELGGSSDAGLLKLRMESPALLDSIGADLMSKAGAGDAASALKLAAGATVQEGKYAVIRGLPDRYVNSQMNRVRLPTADEDKRAVQLDQFPSDVIQSVQVSKTFTPDQQGDASGGAVNVVLKGLPDESGFSVKYGQDYNPQVIGNKEFLTYGGGGINFLGIDDGGRDMPADDNFKNPDRATDALGVSRGEPDPMFYSPTITIAKRVDFDNGVSAGGFASPYYKKDASFFEDGIDDAYWVTDPGVKPTPQTSTEIVEGSSDPYRTALFDVSQGVQEVQWGTLATAGVEHKESGQSAKVVYMHTHVAEDKVTLAEDTRGKQYFFPGYNPDDLTSPGTDRSNREQAPYLRQETLQYTERMTDTIQWSGEHKVPTPELSLGGVLKVKRPEVGWTLAKSASGTYQPDKRFFASQWRGAATGPVPEQEEYFPLPAGSNINLGNVQRIWKRIDENSDQYFTDIKFPFEQWTGNEGYVKLGVFDDKVVRNYHQESFSNFRQGESFSGYPGNWLRDSFAFGFPTWSEAVDITDGAGANLELDVDYKGEQEIRAWYYMVDLPVWREGKVIFGARYESTQLSMVNDPEEDVNFVDTFVNQDGGLIQLSPGIADANFRQYDVLPAFAFVLGPYRDVTLRGAYSQTVARQTFKELSPIQQQEYLGADIFVGNPNLKMSSVYNYDLRLEYVPFKGSLLSTSWFRKDILNPIEYVPGIAADGSFAYTFPVNFPNGEIYGLEFEARMDMGNLWDRLSGLTLGGNFTRIDSQVNTSERQQKILRAVQVYEDTRPMLNAPEHLYNLFMLCDLQQWGTEIGLFYTVRGDTLVAGSGQVKNNFVPSVYETAYGTLNLTLSKKLSEDRKLVMKFNNLLNPSIEEVFRSEFIQEDIVKTSYQKGMTVSMSVDGVW